MESLFPHQLEALEWCKKRQAQYVGDENRVDKIGGGIGALSLGLGKTRTFLWLTQMQPNQKTLIVCSKTLITEWCNEIMKVFGIDAIFENENLTEFDIIINDEDHIETNETIQRPRILILHKEYCPKVFNIININTIQKSFDIVITTYDVVVSAYANSEFSESSLVRTNNSAAKVIGYQRRKELESSLHVQSIIGKRCIFGMIWDHVITDESQRFCNDKTKIFRAMISIIGRYRWALSATPSKNSDSEMWSLLYFCGYDRVSNPRFWRFDTFMKHNLKEMLFVKTVEDIKVMIPDTNHESSSTTSNVPPPLPPIEIKEHKVKMSKDEMEIYLYYFFGLWEAYNKFINLKNQDKKFAIILGLFQRLRQISIAPYLISEMSKRELKIGEEEENPVAPTALSQAIDPSIRALEPLVHDFDRMGSGSAKIQAVMDIIKNERSHGSKKKILVFSSFTSCLRILERALGNLDTFKNKVVLLDGSTSGKARHKVLTSFREDPNIAVMLCNLKVASEGLNLIEASVGIIIEPWFNPVNENQAIGRLWRTGQKSKVTIYRMVTYGTIENQLLTLCKQKESILKSYLRANSGNRMPMSKLDFATLRKILLSTINLYEKDGVNFKKYETRERCEEKTKPPAAKPDAKPPPAATKPPPTPVPEYIKHTGDI